MTGLIREDIYEEGNRHFYLDGDPEEKLKSLLKIPLK